MELEQWRKMMHKSWLHEARRNELEGMHILADAARRIAENFLTGMYDPPALGV